MNMVKTAFNVSVFFYFITRDHSSIIESDTCVYSFDQSRLKTTLVFIVFVILTSMAPTFIWGHKVSL